MKLQDCTLILLVHIFFQDISCNLLIHTLLQIQIGLKVTRSKP